MVEGGVPHTGGPGGGTGELYEGRVVLSRVRIHRNQAASGVSWFYPTLSPTKDRQHINHTHHAISAVQCAD